MHHIFDEFNLSNLKNYYLINSLKSLLKYFLSIDFK